MAVKDRVAFALMFLSDSKLYEYLKRLTQKLIEQGDLAGFLITGMTTIFFSYIKCILISIKYFRNMFPLTKHFKKVYK